MDRNWFENEILPRGQNHIVIPFDELDLTKVEGKGKVGYRARIDSYFRKAKFQARRRNPIVQNMNDFVQWIFYDKFTVAAGGNVPVQFLHFAVPNGSAGKTKVDTNLDQAFKINDPGWMNAIALGFYFGSSMLLLDIQNFLEQAFMEFWVSDKRYLEGPYQCYPGGAGLTGVSTATAQQVYTNGMAQTGNMFDMRLPRGMVLGTDPSTGQPVIADGLTGVTLLQTQLIQVKNQLPGGVLALAANNAVPNVGTGLRLSAYIVGTYSRGVQ
jgi:hypothetical protein